ncbi:MAG TPA: hypothetical protein VFS95_14180, partial [Telluria sp.]|nr:hypothetical protein [Telluria sp.]
MKTTLTRLSAVLIASALSMTASGALAQTAKPAPKAAKPAPTKAKSGSDKLQTKEELRACMMLKESNIARTADLEKRNEENRAQKAVLMQSPEAAAAAAKADV